MILQPFPQQPTREDGRQQRRAHALLKMVAEGLGVSQDRIISGEEPRARDVYLVACRFDLVKVANAATALPGQSAKALVRAQVYALKDNELRWLAQDIAARRQQTVDDDDALIELRRNSQLAKAGELRPAWTEGTA